MKAFLKIALAGALLAAPAFAKGPKSYQVTGEVLAADADVITIQKGKEKWEVARGKVEKPEVKAGDKVTITYTMTADSIESKGAAKADAKADAGTSKADKK